MIRIFGQVSPLPQLSYNVSQQGFPYTRSGCKVIFPETPMVNTVSI